MRYATLTAEVLESDDRVIVASRRRHLSPLPKSNDTHAIISRRHGETHVIAYARSAEAARRTMGYWFRFFCRVQAGKPSVEPWDLWVAEIRRPGSHTEAQAS